MPNKKRRPGNPGTQRVKPEDCKKAISTRLDPDLIAKLDNHCQSTGTKKAWVFHQAIETYLKNA